MSRSEQSRRQASEIRYYKNHDILFHIHRGIDNSMSVGIKSMALPLFHLRSECNNPATGNIYITHNVDSSWAYIRMKNAIIYHVYLKHLVFGVYCTSIMFAKSFAYKVFFRCYSLKNVCHKTASCIYFKGKKIMITSMIRNDNYN